MDLYIFTSVMQDGMVARTIPICETPTAARLVIPRRGCSPRRQENREHTNENQSNLRLHRRRRGVRGRGRREPADGERPASRAAARGGHRGLGVLLVEGAGRRLQDDRRSGGQLVLRLGARRGLGGPGDRRAARGAAPARSTAWSTSAARRRTTTTGRSRRYAYSESLRRFRTLLRNVLSLIGRAFGSPAYPDMVSFGRKVTIPGNSVNRPMQAKSMSTNGQTLRKIA